MTTKHALTVLFILLGTTAPVAEATAQVDMYPGQDVTVNPSAAGTQVLLYPGGHYMRVVPRLAQPGTRSFAPIHLHMPMHHRRPRVAAALTTSQSPITTGEKMTPDAAAAITPPAPGAAKKKSAQTASAEPPPADTRSSGSAAIPFSLDSSSPPASAQTSKKPPTLPPPTQVATTEPPPAQTSPAANTQTIAPKPADLATHAGLVKRSEIIFVANASDPSPSTLNAIRALAGNLSAAINEGAQRIQLEAYGGARHDRSSDARRLSLKRALSVRQLLIDDGVPAAKIDVRAMGGADDKGAADRVDVFVRAG